MQIHRIPFPEVPQLSTRDVAYATQDSRLRPFYTHAPKLETFRDVITQREAFPTDRNLLVNALQEQYSKFGKHEAGDAAAHAQIKRLGDSNTYTVVTAHQPSLFTGPLYFVIKILSTINLSRQLAQAYPDYHFVPLFITGGEDHDFEEINHLHLFGKRITWENTQGGPVGSLSTASLKTPLAALKDMLGDSPDAQHIYAELESSYCRHDTYGLATADYVHKLFGRYGLVVLDMARPDFKRAFQSIMHEELFEQVSQAYIEKAQAQLEEAGFSGQAHAREINLFYVGKNYRERIEKDGDVYRVLNTDLSFSQVELKKELDVHPECFSPNVIMRPLFQELILPNLAYIGGGGEIAYWLERKEQFAHFGIPFPMLIRRSSLLWLDSGTCKRMDKLGLEVTDIFQDTDTIIRTFVTDSTDSELSISEEKAHLKSLFDSIANKAKAVDPTLAKAILAEYTRQAKAVDNLEGRLLRAEKQKHETAINQIRKLKEKLFPNNGLQERYDNFLNFYPRYGDTFFEVLLANLDPLTEGFVVITDQ
jgi:bacillithiol biosynthesis cysteine-adding enzyme BshC